MSEPGGRPDPDVLLARVQQDDARAGRGRLKLFFGANAGVGKTYAMLSSARAEQARGRRVLVGLVETHRRAETEALLTGLPALPRRSVAHRGHTLHEFDLDAALDWGRAAPGGLVLLDELAHSNAPGSRHPKRWQDVQELLAAGIDIWSTLNVQHLESLHDVVGSITGVRVAETLPDHVFDEADEVVVVDLPPDELLARLAAGKVYLGAQAERAAQHFFRKGNLLALRELALRRTADRVDSQMQHFRQQQNAPPVWPNRDGLLACIAPEHGERLVRRCARMAAQLDSPWHAVFVEPPLQRLPAAAREQALRALVLAQELGARTATLAAPEPAAALVGYARTHNLSRLVVGRSTRRWPWRPSLAARIGTLATDLEVTQIAAGGAEPADTADRPAAAPVAEGAPQRYLAAAAVCGGIAALASALVGVLELSNIVMLFLLGVVGVALWLGRGPAVLAAVLGVALFDWFIVPPRYSFAVSDVQYLLTFAVMLVVALVVGQLTAGLKAQAGAASQREQRVHSLYEMSRALSAALLPEQVAEVGARFVRDELGARSALLTTDAKDQLLVQPGASLAPDEGVAQWVHSHGEPAGLGTHTLPSNPWLMLPLKAPMRQRGVLVVQPPEAGVLAPEQRQVLETCATLLAIALERIHYVDVARDTTVQIESERLRGSLLAAISHDLRTPLTALVGLADTLALTPAAQQAEIVQAMRDSALRMKTMVTNLLDMARLEAGAVTLRRDWLPVDELIGAALAASAPALAGRSLPVDVAPELPMLHVDAVLMERVLVNLLENAAKYTPAGSAIAVSARREGASAVLTVDDEGPGLPPGDPERLFDKFERGVRERSASGVGLGLAIGRAIVQAHGGHIRADNRPGAGARFTVTLPLQLPP